MSCQRLPALAIASLLAAVSVLAPLADQYAAARPILPLGEQLTLPTAAVPTAAVPTAAVPTAAVPTAAVPTAAVPTAAVPTAAVPTAAVPDATVAARRGDPAVADPVTSAGLPAPLDGQAGTEGLAGLGGPAAVAAAVSDRVRPRLGWAWPLATPVVVARAFDPPDQPWLPGHRGVDLTASVGVLLRAPHAGTVTFSGVIAGRGVLVVTHGDGLRSTFEPVQDAVPVGTVVTAGEQVATVSAVAGHCAPSTCVHWGVLSGDRYLDPLAVLAKVRVILLPLDTS